MTQPESAEATPAAVTQSTAELEAEIARTRAEVASTLEELTGRIDPRVRATEAAQEAKQAAADVVVLIKGGGLPENDERRVHHVRLIVGASILAVAVVTGLVVHAVRTHRKS